GSRAGGDGEPPGRRREDRPREPLSGAELDVELPRASQRLDVAPVDLDRARAVDRERQSAAQQPDDLPLEPVVRGQDDHVSLVLLRAYAACRGAERAAGCARDELPHTASLRSPHGPATAARYQTSRGSSLRNLDLRLMANREADAQVRDR